MSAAADKTVKRLLCLIPGVLLMCLFFTGCGKKAKITSLEYLSYTFTDNMTIDGQGSLTIKLESGAYKATVKLVNEPKESEKTVRMTDEQVLALEDMLRQYDVGGWNGFNKSNKNVLDGRSFTFYARMAEDQTIDAHGYMKWPKNYTEVAAALQDLMRELAGN